MHTYAAPGASGGHADVVFRAAALELFGVVFPHGSPLPWVAGRNADIAFTRPPRDGPVAGGGSSLFWVVATNACAFFLHTHATPTTQPG